VTGRRARVAVVGGGIGGLAAAWELTRGGAEVILYESAPRLGGKIETSPLAGMPVDAGPDAFLARVPAAADLCREVGLGEALTAPATRHAWLWHDGALRPFPEGLLLGVPTDLNAIERSGLLSATAVAALRADEARTVVDPPPAAGDETIGDLIRRRLGQEVLNTLVDPLLAGIFAGDTDQLSVAAAAPQLASAAAAGPSLVAAARAQLSRAGATADQPVFLTVAGGLGRLVAALASAPRDHRLGSVVTHLAPEPAGGLTVVSGGRSEGVDGAVLAVPGPVAAPLLQPFSGAASALAGLDYASVTLVSFAYRTTVIDREGSGFLVPRSAGLLMSACSWASSKFAHYGSDGTARLRVSTGRWGDDRHLRLDDAALVAGLRADLALTMGVTAEPDEVRISRWPSSLPQYRVGHLDRVGTLEAELAPLPIRVAGASLRGVGLPACIDGARRAAREVLAQLG
jgi:oxygen-dependent protoporphyrinogen oxidase